MKSYIHFRRKEEGSKLLKKDLSYGTLPADNPIIIPTEQDKISKSKPVKRPSSSHETPVMIHAPESKYEQLDLQTPDGQYEELPSDESHQYQQLENEMKRQDTVPVHSAPPVPRSPRPGRLNKTGQYLDMGGPHDYQNTAPPSKPVTSSHALPSSDELVHQRSVKVPDEYMEPTPSK